MITDEDTINELMEQLGHDKAKKEKKLILEPEHPWVPGLPEGKPDKCTCGMESLGGGLHSDWCDLTESKK